VAKTQRHKALQKDKKTFCPFVHFVPTGVVIICQKKESMVKIYISSQTVNKHRAINTGGL